MCHEAGLKGNYSNHSGRVTAVARLYDAGIGEKAIIRRSGHRSIEGVRTYQREDVDANVAVSNALSCATKSSASDSATYVDVDDATLVAACEDYEKSGISNLDISGILQGATVNGGVHIHISTRK